MAHWNHRVMRHEKDGEVWYAIHEVHFDAPDSAPEHILWSENDYGTSPVAESVDGLKDMLERMLASLDKPVLDYETGKDVSDG